MKQCRICNNKKLRIEEDDGYIDNYERGIGKHVVVWYYICDECNYREQQIVSE